MYKLNTAILLFLAQCLKKIFLEHPLFPIPNSHTLPILFFPEFPPPCPHRQQSGNQEGSNSRHTNTKSRDKGTGYLND